MSIFTFAINCLDALTDAIIEWFPASTSTKSHPRQYESLPQRNVLHKRQPHSETFRKITHPVVRSLDQPPSSSPQKHRTLSPPLVTPARRPSIETPQYTYNFTALTMSPPLKSCFRKSSHENQSFGLPSSLPCSSSRSSRSLRSNKKPQKEFRFATPIDDSGLYPKHLSPSLATKPSPPQSTKLYPSITPLRLPRQRSNAASLSINADNLRAKLLPSNVVSCRGRRTNLFTI